MASLGPEPPTRWENLSALDRIVTDLLNRGRPESAAKVLEQAYPREPRPWTVTDQLATIYLHLGDPQRAGRLWSNAASPPSAAIVAARVAMTHLVEGDFDTARRELQDALKLDPKLFEAHYTLATLEQDSGHASAAP